MKIVGCLQQNMKEMLMLTGYKKSLIKSNPRVKTVYYRWILYNILEMKFIEGRKVRDVANRLAMSEADLYRKQRVAVEAVARAMIDMESQAQGGK
jgi:hypothetical protein